VVKERALKARMNFTFTFTFIYYADGTALDTELIVASILQVRPVLNFYCNFGL
jgi:hypothetical protein